MSVWDPNADDPEEETDSTGKRDPADAVDAVDPVNTVGKVAGQIGNRAQRIGKGGGAYEGGLQAALSVVIAMGFGYWADTYFGSSPIGLFIGLAIGFGAFTLRIWQLLKQGSAGQDSGEGPESGDKR